MRDLTDVFLCRLLDDKQLQQLKSKHNLYSYVRSELGEYIRQKVLTSMYRLYKNLVKSELALVRETTHRYIKEYPQDRSDFVTLLKTFKPDARTLFSSFVGSLATQSCGVGPSIGYAEIQLGLDRWDQYNKFLRYPDRYEAFLNKKKLALKRTAARKLSKLLELVRAIVFSVVKKFVKIKKQEVSR